MKQIKPMTATVTIKRPNGLLETVDASKYGTMSQTLADKISAATSAAGKGVVVGWSFEAATYELDAVELAHDAEMADYDKSRDATLKALNY